MTNDTDNMNASATNTWQLNALTEALGDLTLTVTDSLSVGRGSDNDVVLGSKQVSRNHAQLSILNGQLYVKDLASSNGTFINDERIAANESKHLAASDTLGFASFSFQVSAPISTIVIHEQVETDKPTLMLSPDIEIAPIVEAESVVKETFITEILTVESAVEAAPVAAVQAEPMAGTTQIDEPVIKETGITDILAAADKAEPILSEVETVATDAPEALDIRSVVAQQEVTQTTASILPEVESVEATPIEIISPDFAHHESVAEQSIIADEPMMPNEAVLREAPVTEPLVVAESASTASTASTASHVHETQIMQSAVELEHDKTTTTVLQEEADPDVLRAKQAATSQFSGTANLGQPRDLGTEGNNAFDQALDNPANTGEVEKKASGSWFIWVFIAIIIIGLALWLFNTGMV